MFSLSRQLRLSMLLLCAVPGIAQATVVGLSAGDFRVDETGAATYNIPIQVPSGTAGVAPSIALSYSSNNMGEGPIGVGWAIAGLSAISRCPQSAINDNGHLQGVEFNSEDKFCLDGERLLLKSGTYGAPDSTYRTAVDNFSTITAKQGTSANGPLYFEVKNKAGESHYYGDAASINNTFTDHSDAFVEPGGFTTGTLARSWAIKVIKDVKDNYILFNYDKDTSAGTFYISNIQYTGNLATGAAPYAQVDFIYTDHNKGFKGYLSGSHIYHDKRLQRIDTTVDNDNYRSYFLNYESSNFIEERTLLTSVQECPDNDTIMDNCLAPTTFAWQRPPLATSGTSWVCETEPGMEDFCWEQPTTSNYQPFPSNRTLATGTDNRDTTQVIDINGDGYQDLVYVSGSTWYTKLGPSHTTAYSLTTTGSAKKEYALSIDYNGDGVRDLLVASSNTSNWYAVSYQPSTVTHTICPPGEPCEEYTTTTYKTVTNLGVVATGLEGEAQVMDVNGDGMEDIVFRSGNYLKAHVNNGNGTFTANKVLYTFASNVSSSTLNDGYTSQTADMKSASAIDINGDGRSDLIMRVTSTTSGCYVGSKLIKFVNSRSECENDIMGRWVSSTSTSHQLFVASGDGLTPSLTFLQTIGSSSLNTLRVADLNGDGLSDLLYVLSDRWYYRLSDGTQFLAPRDAGLVTSSSKKYLSQFIDLNGDGRTDILHATGTSTWAIYFSRPTTAGEWISFQYRGAMSFDSNAAVRFGDTTGDGKVNLLTATSGTWKEYYNRLGIKENVISTITNGNGVATTITYKPMTDATVYVVQGSDSNTSSDTVSPKSGMQLVSRVTTASNVGSSIWVNYQYGGLLMHKKGRGSLGFQMLRTTDGQSNVVTETRYNQDHDSANFAKAKIPIYTEQRLNGELLSSATNTLAIRTTAQGSLLPYISRSDEANYSYGSDGFSTLKNTTVTTNAYDSWGNLTNNSVTVTDTATGAYQTTTTVNSYGTALEQQYGRLKSSDVTKNATGDTGNLPRKTTYSYNSAMQLSSSVMSPDALATKLTTTYSYDAYGNKTSVSVTGYSTATGTNQTRTTKNIYDSRGRFVDYTENAMGQRNTFLYNGLSAASFTGTLTASKETSANGIATISYFDAFGQLTSADQPDSRTTTITRSFCEGCVTNSYYKILTTESGSADKAVYYDRWGRELVTEVRGFDGGWIRNTVVYDSRGRQSQSFEPGASYPTEFHYDQLNRVSQITKPNGGIVSQEILGLESRTTNELNQVTKIFDNGFGQTASTEDALGNIVTFTYDAYANVTTTRTRAHGKDSVVSLTYDLWGRKLQTSDPIKGNWIYTYNAFGEMVSQKTARNQTFSLTYDPMGRKIRSYEATEGTLCWNYGGTAQASIKAVGKLTSTAKYAGVSVDCSTTTTPTIKRAFSYDSLGRPSNITTTINGVSYSQSESYDSYSRVLVTTYPAGTASFAVKNIYNSFGYLSEVRNNATNALLKRVDSMTSGGQLASETFGNGVVSTRSYQNDTGWLSYIDVKKSGVLRQYIGTTYDTLGNVKSRESHYGSSFGTGSHYTENYNYDNLNRLSGRTIGIVAGGTALPTAFKSNQTYTLDNWGNFTYKTGAGYYQYDATKVHKLLGVYSNSNFTGSLYNFTYDGNGNVTSDGNRTFSYGSYDKPTSISNAGNSATMSYGVDRELYYKSDTTVENGKSTTYQTTYLGGYEKVIRIGGLGALTEHKYYIGDVIYTQRSNSTTATHYLHKDHQGSVVAITDASGNVVSQAIYDPYGKRTAVYLDTSFANFTVSEPTERSYTGHKQLRGLDIIHMGGRIYDPTLGRFLQADPFIQAPKNSQSYNRYAYVVNNPMSLTDPSGFFFSGLFKKIASIPILNIIISVVFAVYCQACLVAYNALSTYAITGSLKSALVAGVSSAIMPGGGSIGRVLASAVIGGVSSKLQGGNFGHGFWSAGLGAGVGGAAGGIKNPVGKILVGAMLGGTVSKITGGKFANGAFSSAFAAALTLGNGEGQVPLDDAESAELANAAYDKNIGDRVGKYTIANVYSDDTGLRAALFVDTSGNSVLAFAGTDFNVLGSGFWQDMKANILQGMGLESAQYTNAIKLAQTYYAHTGGNIRFTGHSLGGGLASAAAVITGGRATVFNAAGIHDNTIDGFNRSRGSITHYHSGYDAISAINAFTPTAVPGTQINLGHAGWHTMGSMCTVLGAKGC